MNRRRRINMDLQYITNPANKQYTCYLPQQRPTTLVAFDIVDKLKETESEFACELLEQLIANFPEVQEFIVKNISIG